MAQFKEHMEIRNSSKVTTRAKTPSFRGKRLLTILRPFLRKKEKRVRSILLSAQRGRNSRFLSWFVPIRVKSDGQHEAHGREERETNLLFWREIVHNVEEFSNLFRCLPLDHVGNSLATNITKESERLILQKSVCKSGHNAQKRFDVEVVGSKNDLEEHFLVDSNEFLVPLAYVSCPLSGFLLRCVVRSG